MKYRITESSDTYNLRPMSDVSILIPFEGWVFLGTLRNEELAKIFIQAHKEYEKSKIKS